MPAKKAKKQAKNRRAGNGGVVPPEEHQFKPGECGNPKGRPKDRPLTDALREMLEANEGKGIADLAAVGFRKAKAGDHRFWKEVMDRIDGKVADRLEATVAADGVTIPEEDMPAFLRWKAETEGGPE